MADWVENIQKLFFNVIIGIISCVVNEIGKLIIILIVTILLPTLFHILGIILSSWISDERCNFGLLWTSCKQAVGGNEDTVKQDSQGLGWSVTALIVMSTFIIAYGCHAFYRSMLELENRSSDKTCSSLFISGVLDLAACIMVRSSCGDTCTLGVSYYLTSVAGWMLVLSGTVLMTEHSKVVNTDFKTLRYFISQSEEELSKMLFKMDFAVVGYHMHIPCVVILSQVRPGPPKLNAMLSRFSKRLSGPPLRQQILNVGDRLGTLVSSFFLAVIFAFLVAIAAAFTLIPAILHLLGVFVSSWISDAYCDVGLLWTSCRYVTPDDDIGVSDSEPLNFDWNVTSLILLSTCSLGYCYSEIILWFYWANKDSNRKQNDIFAKIGKSLFISGILDLSACSSVWSSCGPGCQLGWSYTLVNIAGWIMVLVTLVPLIVVLIFVHYIMANQIQSDRQRTS